MADSNNRKTKKRKGRRARGTGSIFYSERLGCWVGRKVVGRKPNGEPLRVERWGDTQAAVVAKLAEAEAPGPNTTVTVWAAKWLSAVGVRASSRHDYEKSLRVWVLPAVGGLAVADVQPSRFEKLAADMKTAGRKVGTIRKVLSHARILFNAALRDGMVPRNPVVIARKPKAERKKINPFDPAQLDQIITAATAYRPLRVVALLAAVGLRHGEAVALDVPDFDPATGMLSITKTYSRKFGVGPPKSVHSTRVVRVPSQAVPALVAATGSRATGPLFVTQHGTRLVAERVRDAWVNTLKRVDLPFRNPHQLRHSVATAMISAGVPLGDVAKYLGDSAETVVKTYLHPTGADPADAMERLLSGRKPSGTGDRGSH